MNLEKKVPDRVRNFGVADWTRTSTVSHMPLKHARLPFRHSHMTHLYYHLLLLNASLFMRLNDFFVKENPPCPGVPPASRSYR